MHIGAGSTYGCGNCLAAAEYHQGYQRYLNKGCKAVKLLWYDIREILDSLNARTALSQFNRMVTETIENYNLYDDPNGGFQRSINQLHQKPFYNYRYFLGDIFQILQEVDSQVNFQHGYNLHCWYGVKGTPIINQYVGLSYINGSLFCPVPIAHNLLHGLCRDHLEVLLGSNRDIKKIYDGNRIPEQSIRNFQKQLQTIIRERWIHLKYNLNADARPKNYVELHQKLHFGETMAFILTYIEYLLHEYNFRFDFETRTQVSAQYILFSGILNSFWYLRQICKMLFYPQQSQLVNQTVEQNRQYLQQNIVWICVFLENNDLGALIKPNIHYLQCNQVYQTEMLGSLDQFHEFGTERRIQISKSNMTPQRYLQSFIHIANIELYRYQSSFLSLVKYQQGMQLQYYRQRQGTNRPRDQVYLTIELQQIISRINQEPLYLSMNNLNPDSIYRYTLDKPYNHEGHNRNNKFFLECLWDFQLEQLTYEYAELNQSFKVFTDQLINLDAKEKYNFVQNHVKIYSKAFINDNQVYLSKIMKQPIDSLSNWVYLWWPTNRFDLIDGVQREIRDLYAFEIYYFVSFRKDQYQQFQIELYKPYEQLQERDMEEEFNQLRLLAVGISFKASECGSHFDTNLSRFKYNYPTNRRQQGGLWFGNFEMINLSSFNSPALIADPYNIILQLDKFPFTLQVQSRVERQFEFPNLDFKVPMDRRYNADIFFSECFSLSVKTIK